MKHGAAHPAALSTQKLGITSGVSHVIQVITWAGLERRNKMSGTKDLKVLIKQAEQQGWEVGLTKSGHWRWISPTGKSIFCSKTPSDYRMILNFKRELKGLGFIDITKQQRRKR